VSQTVMSLAKESINLDDLEMFEDSALMDSGMDSLTAVSFRNSVQSALNLKMPASLMFDYPTIKEITGHIVEIGGGDGGESEYEEIDVEVDGGTGMGMMPPPEWFMAQQGATSGAAVPGAPAPAQEKAKPKGLDAGMVMQTVRDMAQQAIQLDEKLDADSPLMDSGMDSLTSVSFRNSIQTALGMKVPSSLMFDYPTMQEITNKVVELSLEQ